MDVLTVRTGNIDANIPTIGSKMVAQKVIDCFNALQHRYDQFLIHVFSVETYQLGETYVRLQRPENRFYSKYDNR